MYKGILPDPKKYVAIGGIISGKRYVKRTVAQLRVRELKVFCCHLLDQLRELEDRIQYLSEDAKTTRQEMNAKAILSIAEVRQQRDTRSKKRRVTKNKTPK